MVRANTYATEEARFWSGRTGDRASLIRLDHDLVGAIDPLDPRRTISERRIDADLQEIGRFEELVNERPESAPLARCTAFARMSPD